jgi:pimeloyl-ACP methyl ester carboxylesterase
VRFDHRGLGLSERDIGDFSVDALVRDVDAVVDALEVERVKLTAFAIGATSALAYAARHPGRVSHLVVVNGSDRGVDLVANDALTAASQLAARDWEFASEAVTRAFTGWSDDAAREAAAFLRDSIDPPQWAALMNQMQSWDVSAKLSASPPRCSSSRTNRFRSVSSPGGGSLRGSRRASSSCSTDRPHLSWTRRRSRTWVGS